MIPPRKPDIAHEALFGGKGGVRVWDLLGTLGTAPLDPFRAALACELDAGGAVGPHVQEHFPEIVVGIEGHGVVHVDGVAQRFAAGDVVQLPLGSVMAIDNGADDAPLRYLIVKAAP